MGMDKYWEINIEEQEEMETFCESFKQTFCKSFKQN